MVFSQSSDSDFSLAAAGWEKSGEPICSWQASDLKSTTQPGSLWYGNTATMNYDCGPESGGIVLSPPIALPTSPDVALTFQLYVDIGFDALTVRVQPGAGPPVTLLEVVSGDPNTQQWNNMALDLTPWAGQSVRISFGVNGSLAPLFDMPTGVFVDDLWVVATCAGQ